MQRPSPAALAGGWAIQTGATREDAAPFGVEHRMLVVVATANRVLQHFAAGLQPPCSALNGSMLVLALMNDSPGAPAPSMPTEQATSTIDGADLAPDEANDNDNPPSGVQRWLISCDESGIDGQRYYGFGTLWMPWQRRGDFSTTIKQLRELHRCNSELKWNRVSPRYLQFYKDVIEKFFELSWLSFHCLIVERAIVRRELHGGDLDTGRRKHFTMLLTNKIRRRLKLAPQRPQTFRVWVDPIASRYARADEAVHVISNNVLKKVFREHRPVDRVITKDSKSTPSIQLCDLLLGATMEAWQQKAKNPAKLQVAEWIAHHLGWPDLRADTYNGERKFNIWFFHDKSMPRGCTTRRVKLKYRLPPRLATHSSRRSRM
jgi:hypothetical protein